MARVNKTTGIFLILGVVILITSVTAAWYVESQQLPSLPRKETPEDKLDVSAGGTVDVRSRLSHPSPVVPGVVTAVEVIEGQRVTKGQVLVTLDDSVPSGELKMAKDSVELAKRDVAKAQLAVNEHKANVVKQEGIVSAAKITWNQAQENHERAKKLNGISSNAEPVEIARLEELKAHNLFEDQQKLLAILKNSDPYALVALAEEGVRVAESKAKLAERLLDKYILLAPTNGRVFRLNVSVGDQFAMPVPNMEPRITFCPDEELIVRAEINQEYGSEVREGQIAIISLHGSISTKSWTGKVESLGPWVHRPRSPVFEPDVINDARFRECVIRFDEQPSEQDLVVGTRLRVQIKMGLTE
jgi:multidrug resistance efflux pump